MAPSKIPGNVSPTKAFTAVEGPALVATIVYVVDVPGMTSVRPLVFVMERSPVGTSVSTSVDVLFSGVGSAMPVGGVIVAVFVSVPTAVGSMVPVSEYDAEPVARRETEELMLPVPLAAAQVDPGVGVHVHVAPVKTTGSVSTTAIPGASEGPAFCTVMV